MGPVEYVLRDKGNKPVVYPLSRVADVAKDAWAKVAAGSKSALLIYVHGRDRKLNGSDGEPGSSFREGIVAELEDHRTTVVMLHWPHKMGLLDFYGFPKEHAYAAAKPLNELLLALAATRPSGSTVPSILVTHSMGALVVQELASKEIAAALQGIHSVVLSSPAAPVANSKAWVERIPVRVFLTINKDDGTLGDAEKYNPSLGHLIGKQCRKSFPAMEIASNATYIDVSQLPGLGHRYFAAAGSGSDAASLALVRQRCFDALYSGADLSLSYYSPLSPPNEIYEMLPN